LIFFTTGTLLKAQEHEQDTVKTVSLEEVIVISNGELQNQLQDKPLSSVDQHLEKSSKVNMVKRGNYAWEPAMNNMQSERLSLTIDGMQIFGACTDKMDPITSYADVSNLSAIHVNSGQQGTENGATIGGSIDLKLQKSYFDKELRSFGFDFQLKKLPFPFASSAFKFSISEPVKLTCDPKWGIFALIPF